MLRYLLQSKILLLTIAAQRKRVQRQISSTNIYTHTDNKFLFPFSLITFTNTFSEAGKKKKSNRGSFELAAQLAEFWLCGVGELGVKTLERFPYAHHLAGRKLEPVPQQAGEEVQRLGSRRREPVDAVPHLQKHQEGRILGSLCVRVVQLQDQVLDPLWIKVHAVAEDLQAVDFHVAQVGRVVIQVQRLVKKRLVDGRVVGDDATAQIDVHCFEEGLPFAAESEGPVVALE